MHPGEVVREARKRAGLTQRRLAEVLDMHPNMLSDMERGVRTFRPGQLGELALVLNEPRLFGFYCGCCGAELIHSAAAREYNKSRSEDDDV